MDHRYATLPVWHTMPPTDGWTITAQAGFGYASAGKLENSGPMFSVAASRALSRRWTGTVFAFADLLSFSGDNEFRPLRTLFAPTSPIPGPVDARFDDLDGRMRLYGAGISVGTQRWIAGVLLQQITLRDYRWNFEVLAGDAAGTLGQLDFDADYRQITPFFGMQWVHERGDWTFSPHGLIAVPLPRRGFVGHIETAQFDVHGNPADTEVGKRFGDPSVTLGLDVTYRPARLTVDIGSALSQMLLEPRIHRGIERAWVISVRWQH